MAENFFSSMPPVAWGCDVIPHVDYEKLLEDNGMFMMSVTQTALMHAMEPPKYMEANAHMYSVSCEEIESMLNWEHFLRPSLPVPSDSCVASSADSPSTSNTSDAETAKRCSPETPKQTRTSRKRSESSLTESPTPSSPTPKRRRSSSKNAFVPIVKSKRARALELMVKRDNHNDSERQRRCEMKDGLQMLKAVLPSIEGMSRMNTGQLLEYAITYIQQVVAEEQRLAAEKESLRVENQTLHGLPAPAV